MYYRLQYNEGLGWSTSRVSPDSGDLQDCVLAHNNYPISPYNSYNLRIVDSYERVVASSTLDPITNYRALSFHSVAIEQENSMPTIVSPPDCALPAPASPAPAEPRQPDMMAKVAVTREKPSNRLVMTIDAKPLHDMLDAIGVTHNGGIYQEGPNAGAAIIRNNKLSPQAFLRRTYPFKIDLNAVWPGQPPTVSVLKEVCESSHAAIRTVLEHYQPIDISITISKKLK